MASRWNLWSMRWISGAVMTGGVNVLRRQIYEARSPPLPPAMHLALTITLICVIVKWRGQNAMKPKTPTKKATGCCVPRDSRTDLC